MDKELPYTKDVELYVLRMPFEDVFRELPYTNDVELYVLRMPSEKVF